MSNDVVMSLVEYDWNYFMSDYIFLKEKIRSHINRKTQRNRFFTFFGTYCQTEVSCDHGCDLKPFLFFTPQPLFLSSWSDPALEDEGNLGLVIVLVLFSLVILITVLSLVFVVW